MQKVFDGQSDFRGGMNSRELPERLAPNQYAYGENIEVRSGVAETRRGSIEVQKFSTDVECDGVGVYRGDKYGNGNDARLVARNGQAYFHQLPYSEERMRYEILDPLLDESGNVITTEDGDPILAQSIGFDDMYDDGEGIEFVQALNGVYMLRGESRTPLKWDGEKSRVWREISAPDAGDKIPSSAYGIYAYNRLWLVKDGDALYVSDILSDAFDYTNQQWRLSQGDGGSVVALQEYVGGSLLAFKDTSVWYLSNAQTLNLSDLLTAQVIDPNHGCVAKNSVVRVGNDVWFLSSDGVRSVVLTTEGNAQLVDRTVSANIPTLIDRITWSAASSASATVYDNYYLLSVPIDGSTYNNAIIVYDLELKSWIGLWTGLEGEWLHVMRFKKENKLYASNRNGRLSVLLSGLYEDAAVGDATHVSIESGNAGDLTSALLGDAAGISSDTSGRYSVKFRIDEEFTPSATARITFGKFSNAGGTKFVEIYTDLNGYFLARMSLGGVLQWGIIPGPSIVEYCDGSWHELELVQTGYGFSMSIDGQDLGSSTYAFVDEGAWFADFGEDFTHEISVTSDVDVLVEFDDIRYRNLTGSTTEVYVPFSEGSGSTATCSISNIAWTLADVGWVVPSSASNISTTLRTRGFSFNALLASKRLLNGEVTVSHRSPSFDVNLYTHGANESATLITGKTYSYNEYDVHGYANGWNGWGDGWNDPYRQNYAPVTLDTVYSADNENVDKHVASLKAIWGLDSAGLSRFGPSPSSANVVFLSGLYNQWIRFTNDLATVYASDASFAYADNIAISCFFRYSTVSANENVVSLYNAATADLANRFFRFYYDGSNFVAEWDGGTNSGAFAVPTISNVHLLFVKQGTNGYAYVNGALVATDVDIPVLTPAASGHLLLGYDGTNSAITGSYIDECYFWNGLDVSTEAKRIAFVNGLYTGAGAGRYIYNRFDLPAEGIALDKEQEHTEKFFVGKVSPWAQLEVTNSQGTIGVKDVSLSAVKQAYGYRSKE